MQRGHGPHVPWAPCPRGSHTWRGVLEPPSALLPPTPVSHLWIPVPGRGASWSCQVTCSLAQGLAPGGTIQSLGPCSGGQRVGAVALLPEHGVRWMIPHSSGGSSSPGCPDRLGQDPGWQEGDLPGEGPPGARQAHLRAGKTEARGRVEGLGAGDKRSGRGLCWTQRTPDSEQVDRQMDRLFQCRYSVLG